MGSFAVLLLALLPGVLALPARGSTNLAPADAVMQEDPSTGLLGSNWTLSVIHLNDFHARFEPVSPEFTSCDPTLVNTCVPYPCRGDNCVGGIARVASAMDALRARHPDSITLNAGDNFQGSLWYYVHRHAIMSFFLNRLQFDAMALGNHEFDQGLANTKEFLRRLSFPALSANMDASADPELAELVKPSVVLERAGRRIGVIGYMLNYTQNVSDTGPVRWGGELDAVNREAQRLKAEGVDVIVCVSHDGLAGDLHVANNSPHVDLIVGGHSHTLLYSGEPPTDDRVIGDYPMVVVTQPTGRKVIVVQAMAASKYLGHLLVTFDSTGEVVGWDGRPMLLDQSVPQDARTQTLLRAWAPVVKQLGRKNVGYLDERLSQDEFECLTGECSIGNAVSDAFVDHWRKYDPEPPTVGAVVGWSMVANLEAGDVTYEDVFNVLPYEYTVDSFRISGEGLLEAIESSANGEGLFQWSGVRVELNMSQPAGQRVSRLYVRTDLRQQLREYPELERGREYAAAAQSVALVGGYANTALSRRHLARKPGPPEHQVLATYLSEHRNLAQGGLEGRVVMLSERAHPRHYSGLPNNLSSQAPAQLK